MKLYKKLLNNNYYLSTVNEIEKMKFISNGKWDWEHGLGHYKRVANYVENILLQLGEDKRTIDIGKCAALLHDIGLVKGTKKDHALESSLIFKKFIDKKDFENFEIETLEKVIRDHSNGSNIDSNIGLALVLADKLDVTYHRTINSSIQDEINKEIQKIKKVDVNIISDKLIIKYITDDDFNFYILKNWNKAVTIPYKISKYLGKTLIFMVNDNIQNIDSFLVEI